MAGGKAVGCRERSLPSSFWAELKNKGRRKKRLVLFLSGCTKKEVKGEKREKREPNVCGIRCEIQVQRMKEIEEQEPSVKPGEQWEKIRRRGWVRERGCGSRGGE